MSRCSDVEGKLNFNTQAIDANQQISPPLPSPPLPSPHPRHVCTTQLQSGVLFGAEEAQETESSHVLTEALQVAQCIPSRQTT